MKIHQLVAGFARGDSVSDLALMFRRIFLSSGFESRIYADMTHVDPAARRWVDDFEDVGADPADVYLLHLTTGSMVNEAFRRLSGERVIYYHNMTPAHYFRGVDESAVAGLEWGRTQLPSLAAAAQVSFAASDYSSSELRGLGFRNVTTLPIIIDYEKHRLPSSGRIVESFDGSRKNVVFVGRCVPHKCLEDCLNAFKIYQQRHQPLSRFIHAGSFSKDDRYGQSMLRLVQDLELKEVVFTGSITQAELNAVYRVADVFVCMSEHEGYCIPLIESMVHGVPVVAYDAGAVAETMDGAGVLITNKDPEYVADRIHRLVSDGSYRRKVLADQAARVRDLQERDLAGELMRSIPLGRGDMPGQKRSPASVAQDATR